MTGAHDRNQGPDDGRRPRLAALLWLLVVLAVLQWAVPPVGLTLAARPAAEALQAAGLTAVERQMPAIEAAAPAPSVTFEKRSPGSRSLPSGGDLELLAGGHPPVDMAGRTAAGTAAPKHGHGGLAGFTCPARAPPPAG
ncbi:hypothetical protein [Thalassobaculum sp.]|uniref:hypothetical protein n=1 Tax=Thalassobaculum sp. TaxID=2022740 RepID=UPI0032EE8F3C